VAVLLFLSCAALVAAGPFEDGWDAYNHGDYATALRLWSPLANQGDAAAQGNLGLMYASGKGVPEDYIQAHMWFNLAASSFPASDAENRDNAVKSRDLLAAKLTPEQIAEAQALAREWMPTRP
jgi:TPR repeat protein